VTPQFNNYWALHGVKLTLSEQVTNGQNAQKLQCVSRTYIENYTTKK